MRLSPLYGGFFVGGDFSVGVFVECLSCLGDDPCVDRWVGGDDRVFLEEVWGDGAQP